MRRDILSKIVFFMLAVALCSACKTKKAIVGSPAAPEVATVPAIPQDTASTTGSNDPVQEKIRMLKAGSLNFQTLVIRSKAVLAIGKNSNDVTMNLRIRNGEAIWVSVTAVAGLEVARALITPDSVKVLNRLDNEYIVKPFSYLHEFTNEKITFVTLQSILTGGLIDGFVNDSTQLHPDGSLKTVLDSMLYEVVANDQNRITGNSLSDESAGQKLNVIYSDFQAAAQQILPNSVVMVSQAKSKNISLDLKFSKVEMDVPADMPFRVPDRFVIKN